jgi:hypothetical protein
MFYPGSRKPRPSAVDECANFWPGCRLTRALVRCHGLYPWGSTRLPSQFLNRHPLLIEDMGDEMILGIF